MLIYTLRENTYQHTLIYKNTYTHKGTLILSPKKPIYSGDHTNTQKDKNAEKNTQIQIDLNIHTYILKDTNELNHT